jgi:hypothetical protein
MNATERTITWCSNGQISSVVDPFMAKKCPFERPNITFQVHEVGG